MPIFNPVAAETARIWKFLEPINAKRPELLAKFEISPSTYTPGNHAPGANGTVYILNPKLDNYPSLAVKIAHHNDDNTRKRFKREFELMRDVQTNRPLQHPNIITLYAYGEPDGTPMLLMEAGTCEITSAVRDWRSPEDAVEVLSPICHGLEYLATVHTKEGIGLVHQDIKPANILFCEHGQKYALTDFGTTRVQGRTTSGVRSTIIYRAPEVGKVAPHASMDVYSLGVILIEGIGKNYPLVDQALNGELDEVVVATFDKLRGDPKNIEECLRKTNRTIPSPFQEVIVRALQPDPKKRYQTVKEFREGMEDAIQGQRLIGDYLSAAKEFESFVSSMRLQDKVTMPEDLSRLQTMASELYAKLTPGGIARFNDVQENQRGLSRLVTARFTSDYKVIQNDIASASSQYLETLRACGNAWIAYRNSVGSLDTDTKKLLTPLEGLQRIRY